MLPKDPSTFNCVGAGISIELLLAGQHCSSWVLWGTPTKACLESRIPFLNAEVSILRD